MSVVQNASHDQLCQLKQQLVVDKMKLDKFFSIFLGYAKLSDDNTDNPEWLTYREMLKNYDRVKHLLKTVEYRSNLPRQHYIQNS